MADAVGNGGNFARAFDVVQAVGVVVGNGFGLRFKDGEAVADGVFVVVRTAAREHAFDDFFAVNVQMQNGVDLLPASGKQFVKRLRLRQGAREAVE